MRIKISCLIVIFLVFISSCSHQKSRLTFCGERLVALNDAAKSATVKTPGKKSYAYFALTERQRNQIEELALSDDGGALKVTLVNLKSGGDSEFSYGFLYEEDFYKPRRLRPVLDKRPLVTCGTGSPLCGKKVSLLLCMERDDSGARIPQGFFVHGTRPFYVEDFSLEEAKIGFSKGGPDEAPLFAAGPGGGDADTSFLTADFTGAEDVFSLRGNVNSNFPVIEFSLFKKDSSTESETVRISYAGETINVRHPASRDDFSMPLLGFSSPFSVMRIDSNADCVKSVLLCKKPDAALAVPERSGPLLPITTDPGLIFEWPQENWRCRDYELFRWESFPSVLFFDFADYGIQNSFFTRLAYFVEKAGYKGTLVSDDFVRSKHGYNAHDYKADDLARFFTAAQKENFTLNDSELLLKDILLFNGIIVREADGAFSAGNGAVISISRQSLGYQRRTLLAHESWHGIYFTDEEFRDVVFAAYSLFDEMSMDFLKTYWETQPTLAYDRGDEYLMRNEFMAYILQSPVSSVAEYWVSHAKWNSVQRAEKRLADYVIATEAQAFVDAANLLSSYTMDRWGITAGRVTLVSR